MYKQLILAIGVGLLAPLNTATAAVVSYDVSFSANTFATGSGPDPAPVDPVTGDFTITLDTALDYTGQTAGITLGSLNIALGSTLSFNYNHTLDRLSVGGIHFGSDVIQFNPSTNDFWLFIDNFTGVAAFDQLGYTQTAVSSNNLFYTLNHTGSVSVQVAPPPIPLPAGLPLLAGGIALLGGLRLRRKS
ncbi:MAG: VPLPA-CTERM sorting domain-containing protein [Rhodobacteraceae bacterium]|nr:VPLPA-CTERM sorting domain-containing protein [Paracoccaceae bacterium]